MKIADLPPLLQERIFNLQAMDDTLIGFDFDGVLAVDARGIYPNAGGPIPEMVELCQDFMNQMFGVTIFTSRVSPDNPDAEVQKRIIHQWFHQYLNINHTRGISITSDKRPRMRLFFDDRAVAVLTNKGEIEKPPREAKTALQILEESLVLYRERNTTYGDSYKVFGHVAAALFPDGLTLRTPEEWNRAGVFVQMISKMTRYAPNLVAGGHYDSARDSIVYAAMLEELTHEK